MLNCRIPLIVGLSFALASRALPVERARAADSPDGAWRLVLYKSAESREYQHVPKGLEQIKLVTGGRFVSTLATEQGKLLQAVGGRCVAHGESYTEKAAFVLDQQDEWMVDVPAVFHAKFDGDKWYHDGLIRGDNAEAQIAEVWERLKAPPNQRNGPEGAWRLDFYRPGNANSYVKFPAGWEQTKLVVGGRFAWTLVKHKNVVRAAAGACSVTAESYSETIGSVSDEPDEWMLSRSGRFRWRLDDDKWYHSGTISGQRGVATITEIWRQIKEP